MVNKAFDLLTTRKGLAAYPIAFDLLSFVATALLFGIHMSSQFSLQFAITVGLPSVQDILENQNMAHSLNFPLNGLWYMPSEAILLLIVFLLLRAFVEGGFIGLIRDVVYKRDIDFSVFISYARHYFV